MESYVACHLFSCGPTTLSSTLSSICYPRFLMIPTSIWCLFQQGIARSASQVKHGWMLELSNTLEDLKPVCSACAPVVLTFLNRFWEALSGICSRTIPHPDSQVNRLCISPDKRFLAAAGHHTVKLYDIKSTNPAAVLTFEGHTGNITGVAFHCEGKWMVTSSEDGALRSRHDPTLPC